MDPLDGQPVWAYQCEHCDRWRDPETQPPFSVLVSEPGPVIRRTATAIERARVTRRMVVCPPCHDTMREVD